MLKFDRVNRTQIWLILSLVAIASLALQGAIAAGAENPIDFASRIQPIFVEHCYQCHGPDKQESGLRLDVREQAIQGGDSGPLLVAGKSADSELARRVTTQDEDARMPPPGAQNKPLSAEEVQTIITWIDQGGEWPQSAAGAQSHWSFQPIRRFEPPVVKNSHWPRRAIDRFVLARLEARGLAPSDEASRETLIKRLCYDLLGLPPEPAEVDAFVQDKSADAYERLVDRLLDSPHFGERWGRRWLDLARYADSDGYEKDNPRPDAWRYRDWVIDAVNADLPLDQFTVEQLAGDLLPGATPWQRLATAFHRQTLTNTEGGVDQEQFRFEAIFDRISTTGSVWLGLTVGCAQCHSHKYDPITQQEYYQLLAFFNNGDESETNVPLSGEILAEWMHEKEDAQRKLAELQPKYDQLRAEVLGKLPAWEAEVKIPPAAPLEFHPVELVGIRSSAGSDFKLLSDGSYLTTGKSPEVDRVTITAKTDLAEVTGFRIEALPHDTLSGRGPGCADQGNFVLSEVRVEAAEQNQFETQHRVALQRVVADFSQNGFAAAAAIDGNDATGWAISPQTGRDHWIALLSKTPLDGRATPWLQFVLSQNHGLRHTLGRFRVTAITGRDPQFGLPQDIRDVLAVAVEKRSPEQIRGLADYYVGQNEKAAELGEQIAKLAQRVAAEPLMKTRVIAQRTEKPRSSHLLNRGDFLQPQQEVRPDTLAVLPPLKPRNSGAADRLDLARWLVDPANPLVPRVMVNHLWSDLFGRGIVRTPADFGARGERPTHPELLDYLAGELIDRGWRRKEMIRALVCSATYRQSSITRPELADIDPTNELLHRQNRLRVEGEVVRDLTLAVSGLLSAKVGGPSVFPPLPPDVAELSYAGNFKWKTSEGEDRYRRGMYTFFKRTAPHPNLITFDCPDANTTCIVRQISNTPLQALVALNNDAFVEASQALARRLLNRPAENDEQRLHGGLRLCLVRQPAPAELQTFADLLQTSRQWYATHPQEAATIAGPIKPNQASPAETAAWVATARIMLNLDEFLTRE